MRFLLLLLLVACQPQVAPRSEVTAGGVEVNSDSLLGVWRSDFGSCYVMPEEDFPCSRDVRMTFTETSLRAVVINVETGQPFSTPYRQTGIRFLSGSMYFDEQLNENVSYEVNGNTARICYELECYDLYR